VSGVPRRLVARSHAEAYDLWAREFADPALMANRDAETTRRKLARVAACLPLRADSRVLDVGPGDGALFREIAGRVAACMGVDPSAAAVAKLRRLFEGFPNVSFATGSALALPAPDGSFDVVVVNSVLQILPEPGDVERALAEALRVCRPGGLAFVGELPFRPELSRGLLVHLLRKLYEFGARGLARTLAHTYLRPLLRGEPILLYPAHNLHVPEERLLALAARLGASVERRRHQELARPSRTRNDYWLSVPAQGTPGRQRTSNSRVPAGRPFSAISTR
jgi:ubiquinone/menaquinone biosynthesis C-methylase UbiE